MAKFNYDNKYWLWLSSMEFIGSAAAQRIMDYFETPEQLFYADSKQMQESGVLNEKEIEYICSTRNQFDFNKNIEYLEKNSISFITVENNNYPDKLRNINNKPMSLYVKGQLPQNSINVSVVGARGCSNYGRQISRQIGKELAELDIGVISGMARGIDTYAHTGAIEAGGKTYAVLGCGVDVCYPSENIETYEDIVNNGGIISEFPVGSQPIARHFPMRNRIISGLSDMVIVVEARAKSGSLITAEAALNQGVDVMAVPGRLTDPLSEGCNSLIRDGAFIFTSPQDIADIFGLKKCKKSEILVKGLEKDFEVLYSEVTLLPISLEELVAKTGINTGKIYEMLLRLQMDGLVYEPVKNYYARKYN